MGLVGLCMAGSRTMYLRHCKVLTWKTHQRRGRREGQAACGGVHTWKYRHVANTAHFAISEHDISACMNDVGQFFSQGVLFSRWSENSSESKLHIWWQNISGLKFALYMFILYVQCKRSFLPQHVVVVGDGLQISLTGKKCYV